MNVILEMESLIERDIHVYGRNMDEVAMMTVKPLFDSGDEYLNVSGSKHDDNTTPILDVKVLIEEVQPRKESHSIILLIRTAERVIGIRKRIMSGIETRKYKCDIYRSNP